MTPSQKRRAEHDREGADLENGNSTILLLFALSLSVALLALVGMENQFGAILMLGVATIYAAVRLAR
jgi:hypothetical protein